MKKLIAMLLSILMIVACTRTATKQETVSMRTVGPKAVFFHQPMGLKIGWYPYEEAAKYELSEDVWKIVYSDTVRQGYIPVIIVNYTDESKTVWIDMGVDDAILGRLIKQSLMTQKPIRTPFNEYLKASACSTCHPKQIPIK